MKSARWLVLLVIVALIIAFVALDLHQYLNLETIKARQADLENWVDARPWTAAGIFVLVYVAVTALSLPGAAVMTLVGGALFGLGWGLVLVSLASTTGATLAMLISRFFLRSWVSERFGRQLEPIDRGVERDGAFYLFALRLVPAFPFFIINLAMGLTAIPVRTFCWVSLVGMLPGTLVYVNAGRQLAEVESLGGILSPGLIGAFVLLGVFPLVARKILEWVKARRVYRGWQKPDRFDRNLVVIGAGSGGLVSAYIAATVKAQVTLIEKGDMGGDCLNTGCVPSKTLIRSARLAADLKQAHQLGYSKAEASVDFARVMQRVQGAVQAIAPHDSVERYNSLGVEVFKETARITSPWTVEFGNRTLTTRNIIIATGGKPKVPPIPGLDQMKFYTSETIWGLRERPDRLLVIGGGLIGCELAQAFQRLGCQVSQVQRGERLLPSEDDEVSELVTAALREDGVELLLRHNPEGFAWVDGTQQVTLRNLSTDQCHTLNFDAVLVATGRAATTQGFGAQELELALREDGTLETDDYLATRFPNIYAVGDVTGPFQLTHAASHQAWYAAVNALFGPFKRFRADYRVMPHCVFTNPEVARVGLSENEAKAKKIAYELTRYELSELDRAIAEDATTGFVKVLTVPGKDRILGVTIVGQHAGELIAEYVLAMKHNLGLNKVLGTVHSYPTMAEANKYVAGNWKRAHAPHKLLGWVARFHRWRLG